uniref:Uncharacterized protein n=1 Tax=Rhizophora mucronata TaxID=61149 RepID=A0A2P2P603_RHIMU
MMKYVMKKFETREWMCSLMQSETSRMYKWCLGGKATTKSYQCHVACVLYLCSSIPHTQHNLLLHTTDHWFSLNTSAYLI